MLQALVPLEGARVAELGCGKADFARALIARAGVARVDAFEVDRVQHARNLASGGIANLAFHFGGAEDIGLADAAVDGVVMMKSLHHVPVDRLDRALAEVRRILRPGGFHDEGEVRSAAYAALARAGRAGVLLPEVEREFMAPLALRDFDDFEEKVVRATHTEHVLTEALHDEVRRRFEAHMTADGARFTRPMRANLLRRATA